MPNTPAQIGEGMTVWTAADAVSEEQRGWARTILGSLGRELFVDDENYLDMATALNGTGPAYFFLLLEAMIDAGVHLGLPRTTATELVVQTVVGSAKLLRETGTHPTVLREQVTSPGGTTAAAIRELEDHKVRAAFITAMEAARDRSVSLAEGMD
jgi:pyrroline-5-carboxylate reductase